MHAAAGIMDAVALTHPEASTHVAAGVAFMQPEASMRAAAGIMDAVACMQPEASTRGADAAPCMRGEAVTRAGIRPPNNMAAFERKPPSSGRQ